MSFQIITKFLLPWCYLGDQMIPRSAAQAKQKTTLSFTPLALRNLKTPPKREDGTVQQIDYRDESTPGFGLRISSTGARTWTYVGRVLRKGKMRLSRFTIGTYAKDDKEATGITLAVARAKALELRNQIKNDIDPK